MSEGHEPGDVRSFLPRPGEPVEQYAERLRALHRDLTLVLQAVERGLAAAGPRSAAAPVEVAPLEAAEPHAAGPSPRQPPVPEAARTPLPRVEVLPAASGEGSRADDAEDRRQAPEPVTIPASGSGAPEGPVVPRQRFTRRPSAATESGPEPEWVEHAASGESFTAATFGPLPDRARTDVPPVLVASLIAGWLTVLALLLALVLG